MMKRRGCILFSIVKIYCERTAVGAVGERDLYWIEHVRTGVLCKGVVSEWRAFVERWGFGRLIRWRRGMYAVGGLKMEN